VKRQRKRFTAEQKAAIVRQQLVDRRPIADLCEEHGLAPAVFYRWQKQVFDGLAGLFEPAHIGRPSRQAEEIAELKAKLARKDEVIAEITQDFIDAKKKLGGR